MSAYNLLNEAYLINGTGYTQLVPNQTLLDLIDNQASISVSGVVKLNANLWSQRDITTISLSGTFPSVSGVSIYYGRSSSSLVSGTINPVSGGIECPVSISGYTSPSYVQLLMSGVASGTTFTGFYLTSSGQEIQIGPVGAESAGVIWGDPTGGEGSVAAVAIKNNTSQARTINIAIDLSSSGIDVDALMWGTSSSGLVNAVDQYLSMPEVYPLEWGTFSGTKMVGSGVELNISSSLALLPGTYLTLSHTFSVAQAWYENIHCYGVPCVNYVGNPCIAFQNDFYGFEFIDPFNNSKVTGSNLDVVSTTDALKSQPAWDGGDNLYFLRGIASEVGAIWSYSITQNTFSKVKTLSGIVRGWYISSGYDSTWSQQLLKDGDTFYCLGYISDGSSAYTRFSDGFTSWNSTTNVQEILPKIPSQLRGTSERGLEDYEMPWSGRAFLLGDYVYVCGFGKGHKFARFHKTMKVWELLANPPLTCSGGRDMFYSTKDDLIYYFNNKANTGSRGFSIYAYDPYGGGWNATPVLDVTDNVYANWGGVQTDTYTRGAVLTSDDSTFCLYDEYAPSTASTSQCYRYIWTSPAASAGRRISGKWVSPIIGSNETASAHTILFHTTALSGTGFGISYPYSIPSVEMRGSDYSPSVENAFELFLEDLNDEVFFWQTVGGTDISVRDRSLMFDSVALTSGTHSAGYVWFGLPFSTVGNMHYRFWWSPTTSLSCSTNDFSSFNIVPYNHPEVVPPSLNRDVNTLRRTSSDYFYLRFGRSTDNGSYPSALQFWNGSTTTTYSVTAATGGTYQVELMLNWDAATYKLYFAGAVLGSGTLSTAVIGNALTVSGHTYEFQHGATANAYREQFKALSITRLGNNPTLSGTLVVSPHKLDPLFGENGTLPWLPLKLNSPYQPHYRWVQYALTFQGNTALPSPRLNQVDFQNTLVLSGVGPYQSVPLYMTYSFPSGGLGSELPVYLKAWMGVEKV